MGPERQDDDRQRRPWTLAGLTDATEALCCTLQHEQDAAGAASRAAPCLASSLFGEVTTARSPLMVPGTRAARARGGLRTFTATIKPGFRSRRQRTPPLRAGAGTNAEGPGWHVHPHLHLSSPSSSAPTRALHPAPEGGCDLHSGDLVDERLPPCTSSMLHHRRRRPCPVMREGGLWRRRCHAAPYGRVRERVRPVAGRRRTGAGVCASGARRGTPSLGCTVLYLPSGGGR